MATMEPKDDLGHEEPGASVVLMLAMVHGAIDGFVDAGGRMLRFWQDSGTTEISNQYCVYIVP
jgi:hypothetical protein